MFYRSESTRSRRCFAPLIRAVTLLCLGLLSTSVQALASADTLFKKAEAELQSGIGPRYTALRAQLADYPLAIYLDYEVLRKELHQLKPVQAQNFLDRATGSPLHNRFLAAYIEAKGVAHAWGDLLLVQPEAPKMPELQCYWYRAQWSAGNKALAYRGAAKLWDFGHSQAKSCDPLFKQWLKDEGPNDTLVWSRALKAFDARSFGLLKHLRKLASPALRPLLNEMLAIYQRPDRLVKEAHLPSARHAQLMTVGIRRLARVNPEKGRLALANASPVQPFTAKQYEAMESMIARHSLFAQNATPDSWFHAVLNKLRDDELTEIHLRNHIVDGNWSILLEGYQWLSVASQGKDEWRYWYGHALEATGQQGASEKVFETLATARSYHGFLAAQRLKVDFSLAAASDKVPRIGVADVNLDDELLSEPGLLRVEALWSLNRLTDARAEWRDLLGRVTQEEAERYAELALAAGWINLAVDAANQIGVWDRVDLRFPTAFDENFKSAAAAAGVPLFELLAIARRESALFPEAVSSVGARGLMQVMPATARGLARRHDISYRRQSDLDDINTNLSLGALYYAELLNRFDGNRPMSLAGYNAGPNRVSRWAKGDLPVDRWIDSLPFRETREYVRAVLAYRVIYQTLAGKDAILFSEQEWQHRY